MPRGLTAEQQAYAREVFADLIAMHENQQEIADELGIDQSRVSAIRTTGKTSMQVLIRAALLANRRPQEWARIAGIQPEPWLESGWMMAAGTFLLRLSEQPGLKKWVQDHPEAVSVHDLARGLEILETGAAATYARAIDQEPHTGWSAFFRDVRAGKLDAPNQRSGGAGAGAGAASARRTEMAELGGAPPERIEFQGPKITKPRVRVKSLERRRRK